MKNQKNVASKITIYLIIAIINLLFWTVIINMNFKKQEISWTELCENGTLYGCEVVDDAIITSDTDPIVTYELEGGKKVLSVDVYYEMPESIQTDVWTIGEKWQMRQKIAKAGDNKFVFGLPFETKNTVRVDLGSDANVSVKLDGIIVNKTSTITGLAILLGLICSGIIIILYNVYCYKRNGIECDMLSKVYNRYIQIIEKIKKTNLVRLTIGCWIIFCFGILSILKADFLYIDDLGRNFNGSVGDWGVYSRYFAEGVCKIMSGNTLVNDTSPLNQIITMLLMAISFSIIVITIFPEKAKSKWVYIAAVPFALSPYFLENISYKIECIIHGVSVLLSVMPLLFVNKKKYVYTLITTVCIVLLCITYQGATGIFPVIVVFYAAVCINRGDKIKETMSYALFSAIGYGLGLIIFKTLIMKEVSTHVTSEMLSVKELIPGAIRNTTNYYKTVCTDFRVSWLVAIAIIFIAFIFSFMCQSKMGAVKSCALSIACLGFMLILCNGIYMFLANCVFMPRTMYCFGIAISMTMLYIVGDRKIFTNAICVFIAWCFMTFSMTYGNCLISQKEYTNVVMQSALDYLNEHYDSETAYTLDIGMASIGYAPAIRNQTDDSVILSKLIPGTLGGWWIWAEYKMYLYYDLPDNITPVWPFERGSGKPNLLEMDLPKTDETMWFDVYSDGANIVLSFKN